MAGVDSGGFTGVGGKAVSVRCTGVSGVGGRVAWAVAFYGHVAQGTGHRSRVAGYGSIQEAQPFSSLSA